MTRLYFWRHGFALTLKRGRAVRGFVRLPIWATSWAHLTWPVRMRMREGRWPSEGRGPLAWL